MFHILPLRPRGWAIVGFGVLMLWLAWLLGRRDLLMLAVFSLVLPAVAALSLRTGKTVLTLTRSISPRLPSVGQPVHVTLDVHGRAPGGSRTQLAEELPFSFRGVPVFNHPQPVIPRGLLSKYRYTLHPSQRGVFTIGPLRGRFTDPFDVAALARPLDDGSKLTVAPAAVELPLIPLDDGRGRDGTARTRELAHASHDDAMTREYRHGDPLRRVHWPVTARQGKLMVRAEESVTTPEATLLLDRRSLAFGVPRKTVERFHIAGRTSVALPELRTTPAFEAAVVAGVSIASHLLQRGYTLRVMDHEGAPGFASSASAPAPEREEFSGGQGEQDVAAAFAALEVAPGTAAAEHSGGFRDSVAGRVEGRPASGPLVAVTGLLSEPDAALLASLHHSSHAALLLMVCPDPEAPDAVAALAILHRAGWRAAAMTPATAIPSAWLRLESHGMPQRRTAGRPS